MCAETQTDAFTPAADNDIHHFENLVGQDEQRDQERTLADEYSEPLLDCISPITATDLLNDSDFKDTIIFFCFG